MQPIGIAQNLACPVLKMPDAESAHRASMCAAETIVVKGIMSEDDAEAALNAGADGVFVSNRGGSPGRGVRG